MEKKCQFKEILPKNLDVDRDVYSVRNWVPADMKMEKGEKMMKLSAEKMKNLPVILWRTTWRVGEEDPRRVIHSLKVGLSLTVVSLLYLMEPLFKGIGENAIWAVMTVVVVLEFTAGATLCKGLNRGLGTLLAGSLAFFIEYVAKETGHIFRAVFIGAGVFLIGSTATYARFFPHIKKNYDYGVVIFLLTFNLITVSSYRVDDVMKMAHQRLYTIAIGCSICLLMSLFIFPNWSGKHLHDSTVLKLEGLAKSIEVCVGKYFNEDDEKDKNGDKCLEDPIYRGYKAVLDSKSVDENLALHASWEPRHTRHCYRFPCQQYVKLGVVLRHFGCTIVALHGCLRSEIQTPKSVRALFKDSCVRLAGEVSRSLIELAESIRNRRQCSPEILSDNLHHALQDLNDAIKSQPRLFLGTRSNRGTTVAAALDRRKTGRSSGTSLSSVKTDTSAILEWKTRRVSVTEAEKRTLRPQLSKIAITSVEFSEALPFAAFASLLVEMAAKLDNVIEEIEELGRIAGFKEFDHGDDEIITVTCEKPKTEIDHRNHLPLDGAD